MNRLCGDCSRPMVPKGAPIPEGHARHTGRGRCASCHYTRYMAGTLDELPRRRTSNELLDTWVWLRDEEHRTVKEAAAELGIKPLSLRQALLRARRKGDDRGVIPDSARRDEQYHRAWA